MPAARRRHARLVEVVRSRWLTPSVRRVVVGGPALAGLEPSPYADAYVALVFVPPEVPRPLPRVDGGPWVDLDAVRDASPRDLGPRLRSLTVRHLDPSALELTLDVVVHGTAGLAGPWALSATPGDELLLLGPGGGYRPDPQASRHLLAADASALPAVGVALSRLPRDAVGDAVLEVPGPEDEVDLDPPPAVRVHWVHQGGRRPGDRLVEAVTALPWAGDDVHAFVHGEAAAVRRLRHYLRVERGLGLKRLSVSGYWRLGVDEEGRRAGRRDRGAAIEESERSRSVTRPRPAPARPARGRGDRAAAAGAAPSSGSR